MLEQVQGSPPSSDLPCLSALLHMTLSWVGSPVLAPGTSPVFDNQGLKYCHKTVLLNWHQLITPLQIASDKRGAVEACFEGVVEKFELSRWLSGKESACQGKRCRRHGFDPWVGKIPWSRKWHSTPIFLISMGRGAWRAIVFRAPKELDTTE